MIIVFVDDDNISSSVAKTSSPIKSRNVFAGFASNVAHPVAIRARRAQRNIRGNSNRRTNTIAGFEIEIL